MFHLAVLDSHQPATSWKPSLNIPQLRSRSGVAVNCVESTALRKPTRAIFHGDIPAGTRCLSSNLLFPSAVSGMRTEQPRSKEIRLHASAGKCRDIFSRWKAPYKCAESCVYVQLGGGGGLVQSTSVKAIALYSMERKKGIKINVLWHSESGPNQVVFNLIHMGFERADSSSSSRLTLGPASLACPSARGISSSAHSSWHHCLQLKQKPKE